MKNRGLQAENQNQEENKHSEFVLPEDDFSNPYLRYEHMFDTPPVPFKPRRSNKLDEQIAKVLKKHNFTLPVANIRPGLYLIGTNRCNCDYKFNSVMVKVGGGSVKLEEYLAKNE